MNVGRHSVPWFEHRLKHDWKGTCVQYKKPLGSSRDDKKRALSSQKKGQMRRRSSHFFLPPAPGPRGRLAKQEKTDS
jgi:hypothetical protein